VIEGIVGERWGLRGVGGIRIMKVEVISCERGEFRRNI
jgi:hypothetical protein